MQLTSNHTIARMTHARRPTLCSRPATPQGATKRQSARNPPNHALARKKPNPRQQKLGTTHHLPKHYVRPENTQTQKMGTGSQSRIRLTRRHERHRLDNTHQHRKEERDHTDYHDVPVQAQQPRHQIQNPMFHSRRPNVRARALRPGKTATADRTTVRTLFAIAASKNKPIEHFDITGAYFHEAYQHKRRFSYGNRPDLMTHTNTKPHTGNLKETSTEHQLQHTSTAQSSMHT